MKTSIYLSFCILGIFLFSYPILGLFNTTVTLGGVPLLYCYLLAIWLLLIILGYMIQKNKLKK